MTQSLHPAAKRGFSASAELYQQVRPDYPAEISQWLADTLTLPVDARLLDLGSGTGKVIPYFRPLSQNVSAVRPVTELLAQVNLAHPEIEAIEGLSRQLPLPDHSLNAVFSAQSFPWFANAAALQELKPVVGADTYLVLV